MPGEEVTGARGCEGWVSWGGRLWVTYPEQLQASASFPVLAVVNHEPGGGPEDRHAGMRPHKQL